MKQKKTVTIGSKLKRVLDQEGKSAYRLAKDLGIGQSYLSRLFHNRFNPSFELVKNIVEKLGYEIRFVKRQSPKKGTGGEKSKPFRTEKGR